MKIAKQTRILALLMLTLMLGMAPCFVGATNLPPMGHKNKNEMTDFFQKEVKDKAEIEKMIDSSKKASEGNISSNAAASILPDSSKFESTASEFGKLDQSELDRRGAMNKGQDSDFWNRAHINYNDPQMMMHKQDTDGIVKGSGKFVSKLFEQLKTIMDIDCKQIKGAEDVDPQMYIETETEQQKNIIYSKQLCEQLRNKYSCRDTRTVRCSHVENSSHLNIVGTNLPVIENRPGYARFGSHDRHWLRGGSGTSYDYYINFNISSSEGVQFFKIGSINYDDFVLIKLNGHHVWSGPFGGDRLELVPQGWGKRVIIDSSGSLRSPENDTWFHANLNIDMKQHLHAGTNSLTVRVIVGGKGGLLFDLSMLERRCASWSETWDEVGKID